MGIKVYTKIKLFIGHILTVVTKLKIHKLENRWGKFSHIYKFECEHLILDYFFNKSTSLHLCQGLLFILNLPNKLSITMSKYGNVFFRCKNLFLFPLVLFHLIIFLFYSCLAILIIISYVELELFILHTWMMLVQTTLKKSSKCDTTTLVCIQIF